jgi:hypothetical protein
MLWTSRLGQNDVFLNINQTNESVLSNSSSELTAKSVAFTFIISSSWKFLAPVGIFGDSDSVLSLRLSESWIKSSILNA